MSKGHKNADQYDPVEWALSHKVEGHWFDSWSGHMPGLWVRSPVSVHMRNDQCFSLTSMLLFLSFFLPPPSLKVNKKIFLKKDTEPTERIPNDQSWNNFPNKINKVVLDYDAKYKTPMRQ